ncbi:putative RNase H-like nuclease [Rhodobium orientis]|uniref:DUF429 domain-containing protein n=1 Tax=Rhodobium orientis TaxID=34017 RepID=A0A327K0D4_9HYPH|nr:DUF429 domain-containing protein [Rhodobium orientis]MBB4304333.1 putative RNase H-like nuclease [Rhodobium orientis]MBK5948173.1 hypothetical protein [Rhodobium orientis]RAI28828.1 hypothetical protein CH339_05385 [Rhodobium orientis]
MADRAAIVAGVDGIRGGWIAAFHPVGDPGATVLKPFSRFADILKAPEAPAIIAVDMPIGLPERITGSGRAAEKAVRSLLGQRQSSVFSIPARAAVMEEDYCKACSLALAASDPPKKISKQAFNIFPKIREIDALMAPVLEDRVFEVHPELAFWRLNGRAPMTLPKKVKSRANPEGIAERAELLGCFGYDPKLFERPLPGCGLDDMVDACACAAIAGRILDGTATPFPLEPPRDAKGLRIAIWA